MKALQIKSKSILAANKKEGLKNLLVKALGFTEQKATKIINNCPVIININVNYLTDKDKEAFLAKCLEYAILLDINPEFICIVDINVFELPYKHQYLPNIDMSDIVHVNSIYIVPEQVMESIFILLNKSVKNKQKMHKIADMIGDLTNIIDRLNSVKNILKEVNK